MRAPFFFWAITCTLFTACTCGRPVDKTVICNHDSLLFYAERAYLHDDPKGLYVMGVAARMREAGELPDSLYAVSVDEGDIMLLRSAELGYPEALQFIRSLDRRGEWNHSIPE